MIWVFECGSQEQDSVVQYDEDGDGDVGVVEEMRLHRVSGRYLSTVRVTGNNYCNLAVVENVTGDRDGSC